VTGLGADLRPLPGDPAALGATAAAFSRAATALGGAEDDVSRVRRALADQRGPTVTRAAGRLTDLQDRATTTAHVLARAAQALQAYADELAVHQRAAQDAIARRDAALAEHRRWSGTPWLSDAAGFAPPGQPGFGGGPPAGLGPALPTDPLAPVAVDPFTAQARAAQAADDVRRAEADWDRARDAAATSARRAATHLAPLGDVTTVGLWIASGRPAWSLQGSWDAGSRAALVLDGLATGTASGSAGVASRAAALDEVARLVASGADDDVFWSAFFAATTPEESYVLLLELGLAGDAETTDHVTHAFSAWTRALDPVAQERLGREMLSGGTLPGRYEPIPWAPYAALLLGAPLVPGRVHLGAARAMDDEVRRTLVVPGTGTLGQAAAGAAPGPASDDPAAPVDAQLDVAVFRGLAASGEDALDFFAPAGSDELGRERVARWAGAAPFAGWPDGGEALADALRTAVLDGEASGAPERQERAAGLVARITTALPGGMLSTPVSREAALHLVNLYEPYLGAFEDPFYDAVHCGGTETRTGLARTQYLGLDVGSRDVMPVLDPVALREVVASTASADPDAALRWAQHATSYQMTVLSQVYLPESGEPYQLAEQLVASDDVLRVVGVVHGGIEHAGLLGAEADAQLQEDLLATAATLAGLAMSSVNPIVSATAVTIATEVVRGLLPDHVRDAVRQVVADGGTYQELVARGSYELAVVVAVQDGTPEADARAAYEPLRPGSESAVGTFAYTYDQAAGINQRLEECTS